MMKKAYLKPTMEVVALRQKHQILVGSDNYGMNRNLQEEEVGEGW